MTMQLILNADSAVDIKTTMSITEENLEKCLTAVLPSANGDISKELVKENGKNGYIKEKIEQVNEIQNNTDCDFNLECEKSNNIENKISDESETTTTVNNEDNSNTNTSPKKLVDDVLPEENQKIESVNDETDLKEINENSEDVCLDITAEKKVANDNEAATVSADDINSSTSSNGPCENVSTEGEDLLLANAECENDKGLIDAENSENATVEKAHTEPKNNEVEIELNNDNNDTNVDETVAPEDKDTEKYVDDNKILDENDITSKSNTNASDCLTTVQEITDCSAVAKATEEQNNMDYSLDADDSDSVKKANSVSEENKTEINEITSSGLNNTESFSEKDAIDIPKDDQPNETDMLTVVNSSINNIDANSAMEVEFCSKEKEKIDHEENVTKKIDHEENFTKKIVNENSETSENKSVVDDSQMEIAEEDKSDDGNLIDLVSLNSDKVQIIDEDPTGEKEIDDVNMKVDEPISEKKVETMDMTLDNSDDVIFNLDEDDKDQSDKNELRKSEPKEKVDDDKTIINCDGDNEVASISNKIASPDPRCNDEVIDLDEATPNNSTADSKTSDVVIKEQSEVTEATKSKSPILKLSNTLDILSDDEDESKDTNKNSKCINIEDDDDVMLIDEPASKTSPAEESKEPEVVESTPESKTENMDVTVNIAKDDPVPDSTLEAFPEKEAALVTDKEEVAITSAPEISEKVEEEVKTETKVNKPLLPEKFLKTCKKSLADMTREEIEEFCIVKIVESILDRSNLNEIRNKLKTMSQNIEEYKKKALMLTKQNRDLQVVLKSIQEDQKKGTDSIVPLKITRSVGMQVLMSEKPVQRRRGPNPPPNAPAARQVRNPVPQSPRPQKPAAPQIPVPRLVPASPALKSPSTPPVAAKTPSPVPNGVRNPSPVTKVEKRTHNRIQSVTVDLTDDEPPAKVPTRSPAPVPPVRLVPSQNLLAPPRPAVNSPRKVYIPISGPQGQNVRPGQTIMLKTVPQGPRTRGPPPHMVRMPPGMRMNRPQQGLRHPAPLPDCMKQYQPPNWKALPPAPDLKLAKVENGIVISWKIEGYQEDSYEEIASFQLYAYQETSSPPNTALWKKIGDVKALPLPMACTLTQFMAGYKYYFAVRAVDIRSRLGPFSLPGSILLLNKM